MVRRYVLPRMLVLMLVAASLACSTATSVPESAGGGSDALTDGVVAGDSSQVFDELPTFDPEAPLPSPGAAALRALMALDPSVAGLESDVEAAECAAFNALLADLQAQLGVGNDIEVPFLASQFGGAKVAILAAPASFPAGNNLLGDLDGPINTGNDVAIITALVSGWHDQMTPNVQAGAGTSGSFTETKGGATATDSLNLGRNADGSTNLGFGTKTEATKNGVSVKTDVAASLDGQRCPNADGQVSFTVKVRLGAESGGAGYTQELTAFVRAEVNDDASISRTTFDVIQGTGQVKDGRQVYVETGETIKYDGDDAAGREYSNARMIRHSQDATQADATALSAAGHDAAFSMARTALLFAQNNWLDGGCTMIVATSPGTVQPGSITAIPVVVRHRFDGSDVPSKLKVGLSGGTSVDPTSLAKTPGTLTYTAPNESGKTATITLTATSRRGRATLELGASTGGQAYHAIGPFPFLWSGVACSLDEPFAFSHTGIETGSYDFVASNTTRGSVSMRETAGPCELNASGTYVIEPDTTRGQADIVMDVSGQVICPEKTGIMPKTRLHVLLEPTSDPACP